MGTKKKNIVYPVMFLFLIDQIIKIIINFYFFDNKILLIEDKLIFYPIFNRDYSWLNSFCQFGWGRIFHILQVAIIGIIFVVMYRVMSKRMKMSSIHKFGWIMMFSGVLCSLVDKIIWNGSLDYIYIVGFCVFDLKDVYIVCAEAILIIVTMCYIKIYPGKTLEDSEVGYSQN